MTDPNQVIKQMEEKMRRAIRSAPRIVANEVVNFSLDNFRKQGFQGAIFEPWPVRKKNGKRKGRKILIDSGRLRRGTRVARADWNNVIVANDVPYAKAHNEGFREKVTVKAHSRNKYGKSKVGKGIYSVKTRKERTKTVKTISGNVSVKSHSRRMNIRRRRFLGTSPYLTQRLKRALALHINKALK